MISTEERSPSSGGDEISSSNSTSSRLSSYHQYNQHHHPHNNNQGEDSSLYYQYIPSSSSSFASPPSSLDDVVDDPSARISSASSTPTIHIESSPPSSPVLRRQVNQIVLRDPNLHQHHHLNSHTQNSFHHSSPAVNQLDQQFHYQPQRQILHHHQQQNPTVNAVALPRSSSTSGLTDFIQQTLSSRLIPKLGSIVKRFNLNYSGEGLLSDRQRTRTVRVGIRFQVQVDSFVGQQQERPRSILRTQSAPAVEQLDSGFSSPTEIYPQNNRQLAALEYQSEKSSNINSTSSCSVSSRSSFADSVVGGGSGRAGIIIGGDTSSGVSSEATSPVLNRRQPLQSYEKLEEQPSSATLAFHNRINQALHSYRKSQQQRQQTSPVGSPPSSESFFGRREVFNSHRRGTNTPPEGGNPDHDSTNRMEDSSSYQVLRHFPGSNVNSLNELNWETAAFEKEIRDRVQWIGNKISSLRVPRVISQLINFGKDYAKENPVSALILLALCLTSSFPVLMFLVFAVATILVTFLGFLFVEGTLLTVATVIFSGVILVVGFVTLTAILIGMLGYFTTNQAYLVLTGRSRIFRLLRKLPIIGRFFPEPSRKSHSASSSRSGSGQEDEEISKLLQGMVNGGGKVSNGYHQHHPHHHDSAIDYEDDDILDDSELDEEDETTAGVIGSDSDLGLENEIEDEDIGNQEVIISEEIIEKDKSDPEEINNGKLNGKSSSLSISSEEEERKEEATNESSEATSTPSPVYTNGHGENKHEELETVSDNSEL